jgi:4-hydroxy-tetrahydrodipicolinate synthase
MNILYTALVTPFDKHGELDFISLERLVRAQESASNGIVLFGSTGESLALSDQERQKLLTFVCNLKAQISLIVGVPSYNLNAALQWLHFCRDLPLDGYLMTTPIYTKAGIKGQSAWFEKLLDNAAHKAMLYNIPSRAGVHLYSQTIKNLAQHPRLWALKDSSGGVESLIAYRDAAPTLKLLCGDDYLMPAYASLGAEGLVSVLGNAWPQATRRYVIKALTKEAFKSSLWWHAGKALTSASNPIPIKALLKDIGLIDSDTLRLPLDIQDLPSRDFLLEFHPKLCNWNSYE